DRRRGGGHEGDRRQRPEGQPREPVAGQPEERQRGPEEAPPGGESARREAVLAASQLPAGVAGLRRRSGLRLQLVERRLQKWAARGGLGGDPPPPPPEPTPPKATAWCPPRSPSRRPL